MPRVTVQCCRYYLFGVLLIASSLKLAPLFHHVESTFDLGGITFAAIACVELCIGLLVFSFYNYRPAQFAAGVLFLVFAAISLSFVVRQSPSCGCFGRMQTPPVLSLLINVLAILALVHLRRRAESGPDWSHGLRNVWFGAMGCAAAYAIVFIVEPNSYLYCQLFGGSPLRVTPPIVVLETDPAVGGHESREITVQNNSAQMIRLVGAKYGCGPLDGIRGLPATIPAFQRVTLRLALTHLRLDEQQIATIAQSLGDDSLRELTDSKRDLPVWIWTDCSTFPYVEVIVRERFNRSAFERALPMHRLARSTKSPN